MDKTTIPHAGGLAASTCRKRRRAAAKPAESAFAFGPSSVVRRLLFATLDSSLILGFNPYTTLSSVALA
jgi:hypothetical protein